MLAGAERNPVQIDGCFARCPALEGFKQRRKCFILHLTHALLHEAADLRLVASQEVSDLGDRAVGVSHRTRREQATRHHELLLSAGARQVFL